jgi:uncharacterized membrane protein YhhN
MGEATLAPGTMSKRTIFIAAAGFVAGALYLFSDTGWVETVTKPLPVLCMALALALQPGKGRYQWAVITGLLLSGTADVVISLHFVGGVAVFFLAHIAYIAAFLQDGRQLFPYRALLAFGYGAIVYAYLLSAGDLGALVVPILLYAIVISAMLWRAAARVGVRGIDEQSGWAGSAGAAFFVLSDTLLIVRMVVRPIPLGDYLVMLTYWVGQLGITLSAAWQKREEREAQNYAAAARQ